MTRIWQKVTLHKKTILSIDTIGLEFECTNLKKHTPGQFYFVRIPLPNGGTANREYSIASPTTDLNKVEFGIQKVEGGIVSGFLHELEEGDQVEIKGPIGEYFNWDYGYDGPVMYIAGGSGIIPFMSMIRSVPKNQLILIASFKTLEHFSYFDELQKFTKNSSFTFLPTLTREKNKRWKGRAGRIDPLLLKKTLEQHQNKMRIFVCGRSSFVEDIYEMLISLGVSDEDIQRERFG